MAGSSNPRKCRNRKNHNCSPCSDCGASEHDFDNYGRCTICNEWEDDNPYEEHLGGGGFERFRGRIIKKPFDDDDE